MVNEIYFDRIPSIMFCELHDGHWGIFSVKVDSYTLLKFLFCDAGCLNMTLFVKVEFVKLLLLKITYDNLQSSDFRYTKYHLVS